MGRILSIDYGQKRVGIAVTDILQIIPNGLTTVHSKDIFVFLEEYLQQEEVDTIVVGYPVTLKNEGAQALKYINPFLKKLIKKFPDVNIEQFDERFTSKMAKMAMIEGGMKKKDRQNKALVDKISATIILQSYMEASNFKLNYK